MNKATTIAAAILMSSFSSMAFSLYPPEAPMKYENGPLSPFVADSGLTDAERAAYSLYEGLMQIAEAKIHASNCTLSESTSDVNVFANGSLNNRSMNFIDVESQGGTLYLDAALEPKIPFRGQIIRIKQQGLFGLLENTVVLNYSGTVFYNEPSNILYGSASVDVHGINGYPDTYQSTVIKDFYRGSANTSEYYTVFNWGLQSLHKLGYPVNKYWQRSKSRRNNGSIGRTVFVKDRLVGSSSCRITIDTIGSNNEDFFSQTGTLVIENVDPKEEVPAFNEHPFNL